MKRAVQDTGLDDIADMNNKNDMDYMDDMDCPGNWPGGHG